MKQVGKQWKVVWAVLLAVTMLASSVACSSSGSSGSATPSPEVSGSESKSAGSDRSATPVSGKIVIQTWTTEIKDVMDIQLQTLKAKHPELEVKLEILGYGDYWEKLPISIASGLGPDIYLMTLPNFDVFARAGQAADISSMMESSQILKQNAAEVAPDLIEAYQYEGKQMGYPLSYESTGIIFNKNLFEAAGLPLPTELEKTWTWEDLREMAGKLTKREGDQTVQYGYYVPANRFPTFEYIWANGAELFTPDGKECVMAGDKGIGSIQFLADLMLKDKVSPTIAYTQTESSTDMFLSGKIAMMSIMNGSMAGMMSGIKDFEWDVAEMPINSATGKRYASSNVLGYVINPNTKNMEACRAFLESVTMADQQALFASNHIYIPANTKSQADYFNTETPANFRAFERALEYAKPLKLSPYVPYAQLNGILAETLTNIYNGTEPVDTAWKKAQQQVNEIIAENMDN